MQFIDSTVGDYRIYVGALESEGGYTAALIVEQRPAGQAGLICFRDDSLACGYRWPSAEQAMTYAMSRGREMVRRGQFDGLVEARQAA